MPPLPLPWPYLPDGQPAGSFEDRAQQNFDALAGAVGLQSSYSPWIIIGAAGAPAFANAFATASTFAPVAFVKDPSGWVHVKGSAYSASATTGATIFTLPAGYRPSGLLHFPAGDTNTPQAEVRVSSAGLVQAFWSGTLSVAGLGLDVLHFRGEQ